MKPERMRRYALARRVDPCQTRHLAEKVITGAELMEVSLVPGGMSLGMRGVQVELRCRRCAVVQGRYMLDHYETPPNPVYVYKRTGG